MRSWLALPFALLASLCTWLTHRVSGVSVQTSAPPAPPLCESWGDLAIMARELMADEWALRGIRRDVEIIECCVRPDEGEVAIRIRKCLPSEDRASMQTCLDHAAQFEVSPKLKRRILEREVRG